MFSIKSLFWSSLILLSSGLVGCSNSVNTLPIYNKVIPGSDQINPQRITAHKIRYQKMGSEMFYQVDRVTYNSQPTWRFQVLFKRDGSQAIPDAMYAATKDLAYLGRRLSMKDYVIDVKVENNHFYGELLPTDTSDYSPVKYDKRYPHGAFEPAIINYFIAALPLAEGYKASIPVFDLNQGSQMLWSNIEVLGRETLELNGKRYDTWKVLSKGIKNKTLWISTSEPYAIKMETDGSFGSWQLVE